MTSTAQSLDTEHSSSANKKLTTDELSLRWMGLPTPGTLRNWRVQKIGPAFEVVMVGGVRHVLYPLAAVEQYELKCSSIPRHKPWSGRFLTTKGLLERWKGKPDEVTESTLREWRSERGRRNGPSFITVHLRQALYPIEAVRLFEKERADARLARARDRELTTDVEPAGPTFGEILAKGPVV
jgi:hypothetical protein